MQKHSLEALARDQLAIAHNTPSARSATTVFGGHEHALRQTVLALCAGAALDEHENPGEATVYVLEGRVEMAAGDDRWQARRGDLLIIPDSRHALRAIEDSVVLLSAVPHSHLR
jgi:quercetin dioxygenase-like cupin family protein